METSGRERRHRYYTVANYYKLVSEEALDKSSACFTDIDLVNAGRFYAIRSNLFYENDEELVHRQDDAKDSEPIQGSELKKSSEGKPPVRSKRGQLRNSTSIQGEELDGKQGRSSAKRKRKDSSLSGDKLEVPGLEEPAAKKPRLNGTSSNVAGMLFLFIYWQRLIFGVQRKEASKAKPTKVVLINQILKRKKREVVQAYELRLRTLTTTLITLGHQLKWNIRQCQLSYPRIHSRNSPSPHRNSIDQSLRI